ncbi:hypothetical protein ABZ208_13985 [Streptomyces sp. NPDC006208]|uniref:DUF6197 family protein n=1 Tax=Streptomyces sp. NPDC006208 TaxID=3156734 RepID=UPI0033AA775A
MTGLTIHDVVIEAAHHIECNGYSAHYLYSVPQAQAGRPLAQCAVDVIGAISLAAHGTPAHPATALTRATEQAVLAHTTAPSLAAWSDYKGNGKQRALALLQETAAGLRAQAQQQDQWRAARCPDCGEAIEIRDDGMRTLCACDVAA